MTRDGRLDIETIAHKMVSRLEILTKENEEMGKILSYGRANEMNIQLGLARIENEELKKKISSLTNELENLKKK